MDTWRIDLAGMPAFAHLTPWLTQVSEPDWPDLAALNMLAEQRGLRNSRQLALRFVAQTRRCGQHDYETGIYNTGQVPSRENNWHDFLNAMIWLAFPATKAALNAVHHANLPRGSNRTTASDAATLFDESGLVLVGEDESLVNLLAARRWQEAFVQRRAGWRHLKVYVIGHAVLEKLLSPWPGITAKCLFIKAPSIIELDSLDALIAERWRETSVPASANLFPLPVAGIPGWWPANEAATFYADEKVFRPPRTSV